MLKRLLHASNLLVINDEHSYLENAIQKGETMGKYQLDYKGMQQVERFHEKHSTQKPTKKNRVQELRAQFIEKSTKQKKKQFRQEVG